MLPNEDWEYACNEYANNNQDPLPGYGSRHPFRATPDNRTPDKMIMIDIESTKDERNHDILNLYKLTVPKQDGLGLIFQNQVAAKLTDNSFHLNDLRRIIIDNGFEAFSPGDMLIEGNTFVWIRSSLPNLRFRKKGISIFRNRNKQKEINFNKQKYFKGYSEVNDYKSISFYVDNSKISPNNRIDFWYELNLVLLTASENTSHDDWEYQYTPIMLDPKIGEGGIGP